MRSVEQDVHGLTLVDDASLVKLREQASNSEGRKARLNLHAEGTDPIQEMIITFCGDCTMAPGKSGGKSESLHMIEGEATLLVFDDDGTVMARVELGQWGTGKTVQYRMQDDQWHTLVPKSAFVTVHEILRGPFEPEKNISAPWVPSDAGELRAYLEAAAVDS